MKNTFICLILLYAFSCSKSESKQEIFKCKVNGVEAQATNAFARRDSSTINIDADLNNGYHFAFSVYNSGNQQYNLGYDNEYVEVVGNSKIFFLNKPSDGNGILNIESTKGWDFNKRMNGSFQFTIGPQSNTPFIVTEGIFKNVPTQDY